MLKGNSVLPDVEVQLHIVNPNFVPLTLSAVRYHIELEGLDIISGAAEDLPVISGHGEGDVVIRVSPDPQKAVQLLTGFLFRPKDSLTYHFKAHIDMGLVFPDFVVEKSGKIKLDF